MKVITHSAIEASAELAEEKGCFAGCDPIAILENTFIKRLDLSEDIKQKVLVNGLRNSSLFSIQPNGNSSILEGLVSGGCEPVFLHEFIRTVIVQSPPEYIKNSCPKYWLGEFVETDMFKFVKEGEEKILRGVDSEGVVYKIDKNRGLTKEVMCEDYSVNLLKQIGEWEPNANWAVTTKDLTVDDHIKDLKGWAKWVDASISKTINLPHDYPYDDFKKIYTDAYKSGVIKGITTCREGTMTTVLSSADKKEEKRPKKLPCHIYHPVVRGEKYYVCVGMKDSKPYEIFAGNNGIDNSITDGYIQRIKGGKYTLISNNEIIIDNLTDHCSDEQEAIARLASISLRSDVDIKMIVNQLDKTRGNLQNFGKVMCRILRKYVPSGTQADCVCPDCGEKAIHSEGCIKCICGWSKC